MPKQIPNIINPILDHPGPFQLQSPGNHQYILGQSHRREHFRSEHSQVPNLCPFLQVGMVAKDFHGDGGLCVGIGGGFETKLHDTNFEEEGFNHTNQIAQAEVIIGHQALHLMELTQVRRIHTFIAKDSI